MKRLFAITIALTLSCTFAQASDIIYSNLRTADKWIVKDIFLADMNPSCIKNAANGQCDVLLQYWTDSQGYDAEGKKYLESISNKPPHIKNQIMKADFGNRYKQILEQRDENICFDFDHWKFINSNTGYFMASEVTTVNERPAANNYKITYGANNSIDGIGDYLILMSNSDAYIQEIPNKYITEDVYVKFKSLLDNSYMRICGKIKSQYNIAQLVGRKLTNAEMQNYTVEPRVVNFIVSRPIEFYKTGTKTPSIKIPFDWYK